MYMLAKPIFEKMQNRATGAKMARGTSSQPTK